MPVRAAAENLIEEFRSRPTLRAGSLLTTVFGDAIAPRGGAVWIGSLISVMAPFGISERLVRTSMFRLSADGWLVAQPVGRRSYYGLTRDGAARFAHATERIYGEPRGSWDGEWCLVLLAGVPAGSRDEIRRQLRWQGFGAIGPNVLAHPSPDEGELRYLLRTNAVQDDVVVLTGRSSDTAEDQRLGGLLSTSWKLDDLNARFRSFEEQFGPVLRAVRAAQTLSPEHAFQIRTLLIQEYRKILLRDPHLPEDLLPAGWRGGSAYGLCRDLYRAIFAAADEYIDAMMRTVDGRLPPPGDEFYERFGGLDAAM